MSPPWAVTPPSHPLPKVLRWVARFFGELRSGLLSTGPVGNDVQQPALRRQVIRVGGGDLSPVVAGRVGQFQAESLDQPGFPVGPMVRERFAGPLAGDQD